MHLLDVLNEDTISLELKAENKTEALEELAALLEKSGRLLDRQKYLEDVYEREQTEPTDLGIGVAIPHAKSAAVKKTSVAIGKLRSPILWNAVEDSEDPNPPVKVIFLLAVTEMDKGNAHIELISKIATLLIEERFVEILFKTDSKDELLTTIKNFIGEA